jgi:hypothetical protein
MLPSAQAQSTFGDLRGTTRDPSGMALAQATVTVHNLDANTDRSVISGDDGSFVVENLLPGHYQLTAAKMGFQNSAATVELSSRQSLRVDLTLALASQSQTIEVSESVEQVNTENAALGDSKVSAQITGLPLNFRAATSSPLAALATSPNVQQDSQGNIAMNGSTANQIGYSVDGISTANVAQSNAATNPYPSSEAIAELKVTAFNNSAEFSQVGDVTFTTKGGTNNFHGSVFEYLQNDALDATVLNFGYKAPKRFNTFGGSSGGPLSIPKLYDGHNKTFFFFDYEGNRKRLSQPEQYLVPTAAERSGNLSGLAPANSLIDPLSRNPFPNNTIPASRLNATSLTLLDKYYPLPNTASGGSSYNYETLQPIPSRTDGLDGRIDQVINSKQQLYVRYNWKNVLSNVANPLLPNDLDSEHDRSFLVSHNYVITQNLLNEFRFGFTHLQITPDFPIEGAAAIAELGFQNVDTSNHPTNGGFPSINFSDGTGFTPIGRDIVGPTNSSTDQFADNITYNKGKHALRAGADLRRVQFAFVQVETPSDDYGLFTFNQGVFTGNAFGDLLLGLPNTTYFAVTGPREDAIAWQTGLYAQDEWRVNDRVTVNAGLRWELLPPFLDINGNQANFDPAANAILINQRLLSDGLGIATAFLQSFNACTLSVRDTSLPCTNVLLNSQVGLPAGLRQLYKKDFDPRIGIAYRPFNDTKTVIRAGFGIFTVTNLGQLANNNEGNPEAAIHTYQNAIVNGAPLIQFPNTVAASQLVQLGGGTIEQATDPHFRDPQSAQWNVTLERQVNSNTAVRLSYVGMNSYRLGVSENLNQIAPSAALYVASPYVDPRAPFPNWGVIYSTENGGFQNYQAMETEVSHRMSNGLSFQANYTWAHDVSDAQGDAPIGYGGETAYGLAVTNRFDIAADRGNVAGARRQRFLLTGTYELPFGKGRRWLKSSSALSNGLLGGWNLNTVTTIETGPYLTPTISVAFDQTNTDPAAAGSIVRPDLVGNPIPSERTQGNYYNINAFAPTPVGAARIGNAGVGILEGPGTIAVNGGLSKAVQIREGLRLRFEATFTNALNHTNFAPPATNVSSPSTFGVLQSAQTAEYGGNRTGQLALRLDF